uniref:Uncharacterized protein n=1 Tax=Chromera velia CCMP2878 TaxID=1169474 RepID=A0A0G4GHK1_9ALVE|eukprot:Cvel_668.t1-p1 / transcript=Cvel_668.t1 / gene=Cvel_668 / organism=Chromera_velia_CCMP2878 / gene_product=hypothetical protein / transcript_product=hypothetical protein / location=Cvel_scaffold20:178676-180028(+) / protein_length=451 / sequence_SO=supercontig / SO=protein_coding / is_pseudo=false
MMRLPIVALVVSSITAFSVFFSDSLLSLRQTVPEGWSDFCKGPVDLGIYSGRVLNGIEASAHSLNVLMSSVERFKAQLFANETLSADSAWSEEAREGLKKMWEDYVATATDEFCSFYSTEKPPAFSSLDLGTVSVSSLDTLQKVTRTAFLNKNVKWAEVDAIRRGLAPRKPLQNRIDDVCRDVGATPSAESTAKKGELEAEIASLQKEVEARDPDLHLQVSSTEPAPRFSKKPALRRQNDAVRSTESPLLSLRQTVPGGWSDFCKGPVDLEIYSGRVLNGIEASSHSLNVLRSSVERFKAQLFANETLSADSAWSEEAREGLKKMWEDYVATATDEFCSFYSTEKPSAFSSLDLSTVCVSSLDALQSVMRTAFLNKNVKWAEVDAIRRGLGPRKSLMSRIDNVCQDVGATPSAESTAKKGELEAEIASLQKDVEARDPDLHLESLSLEYFL